MDFSTQNLWDVFEKELIDKRHRDYVKNKDQHHGYLLFCFILATGTDKGFRELISCFQEIEEITTDLILVLMPCLVRGDEPLSLYETMKILRTKQYYYAYGETNFSISDIIDEWEQTQNAQSYRFADLQAANSSAGIFSEAEGLISGSSLRT